MKKDERKYVLGILDEMWELNKNAGVETVTTRAKNLLDDLSSLYELPNLPEEDIRNYFSKKQEKNKEEE